MKAPAVLLRALALMPKLAAPSAGPATLAGPLVGWLASRLAAADLLAAVETGLALGLALCWITAPALIEATRCDGGVP